MKPAKDISQAKNPDLRGSLTAMQRASERAKRVAIQTNTTIVVSHNGKLIHITADELRRQARQEQ